MSYTQLGLYIDGKWNHGNGGGGEDVHQSGDAEAARAPAARHDQRSRCGTRRRRQGLQAVEGEVGL